LFSYEKIFNSNELVSEQNFNPLENKKITFPDGSTAYLKNNTLVNYPNTFRKTARLINIKGEAFFDVKSNPSKPFIIKAEKAKIEVLGTSFNVRTNENGNVEVYVKSGKVKLSQVNEEQNSLIIEPGYIGVIAQDEIKKMKNDNQNYLSWVTKKLYFKDTGLKTVTQTLEKTYNVEITTEESINSGNLYLTSTFNDESIDYILKVISRTFDIQVKQKSENQYLLTN
ncbi:MAG: FecR family protein, partial [Bacteroidota bacterium]